MTIPFFDAKRQFYFLQKKIANAIDRVLRSGKYILGNEGLSFENEFSAYIGVKYAIGVNSGTDALKIALRSLSIGEGDDVITTTNTAVPTVSAIRETGAKPIFVDIDKFFTIDPKKIEAFITKKTKAVIAVHLYGQPADIMAIKKITKKHKIALIEDCAQAVGATIGNKKIGNFGDMSCFSFYPTKNLGAYGDGGMILTNNKRLAEKAKLLRMYGMKKTYCATEEGFNSRLDEIQAAILRAKLPHLETWNRKRETIATFYNKYIKNDLIKLPQIRNNTKHVFHLYVIRAKERLALKKYLKKNGIGYGIHYEYPIHKQRPYKKYALKNNNLKESEQAAKEIVSLPIFPELTHGEIKHIVKVLNDF